MEDEIDTKDGSRRRKRPEGVKFTEVELSIIRMICEELTTEEIAKNLNLTNRTVVNYRQKLLVKTGSKSSLGIVTYAIKNKIYTDI